MVFNILIALMLMELDVFQALGKVLGLYSNIAISWMTAVVADLVINKPLGWSPKGIEFKRAHLYDVNPVGVGAMGIASVLSIAAYPGALGEMAQAFSALIALATALVVSPLLAWATGGRYYLARQPAPESAPPPRPSGSYRRLTGCVICEREYESDDMAHCPAYRGSICSLCCSLDARCHDLCKPHARLAVQWRAAARQLVPQRAVAAARYRARPLPDADARWWRRCCAACSSRSTSTSGARSPPAGRSRHMRKRAAAGLRQAVRRAARDQCGGRLVAGAQAPQRAGRAGRIEPADPPAGERDRIAPPHRRSAAGCQAAGRARQRGQEPLHHDDQPRTANAAEQHHRLCAAARRGCRHSAASAPGGQRDPPRRRAPAVADRRHARPGAHRKRQAVARRAADAPARVDAADRAHVRAAGGRQGNPLRTSDSTAAAARSCAATRSGCARS